MTNAGQTSRAVDYELLERTGAACSTLHTGGTRYRRRPNLLTEERPMEIRIESLEEGFVVSEFDGRKRKEYAAISPTDALWRVQDLLIGDELSDEPDTGSETRPYFTPEETAQAILDEHGGDREAAIRTVAADLSSAYPQLSERIAELVNAAYPEKPGVFDDVPSLSSPTFKEGDKVWCEEYGSGRVTAVSNNSDLNFPVFVEFGAGTGTFSESYTADGHYFTNEEVAPNKRIVRCG